MVRVFRTSWLSIFPSQLPRRRARVVRQIHLVLVAILKLMCIPNGGCKRIPAGVSSNIDCPKFSLSGSPGNPHAKRNDGKDIIIGIEDEFVSPRDGEIIGVVPGGADIPYSEPGITEDPVRKPDPVFSPDGEVEGVFEMGERGFKRGLLCRILPVDPLKIER